MIKKATFNSSLLFLIPALAFVLIAELVPVAYTIYLGLTEWDFITPPRWVGLANYFRVFSTPVLLNALKNTVFWVIGTLVFAVGFPLLIAMFLNLVSVQSIFKAIFIIPSTLSPTVAAIFWNRVLVSRQGALMPLFEGLGLSLQPLLPNPHINTFIMIGVWIWQYFGINLILFMVGLDTVPQEPVEAAVIDGATYRQVFTHVTLPLLRPIVLLVVANAIINSIRMFDIPWVMIEGGPGRASETLAISLYRESFLMFRMGLGSSIAVVISIFALLASYRYLMTLGKERTTRR